MRKWIARVLAVWVDYRHGLRQRAAGVGGMMIRDDDVDAALSGVLHFIHTLDAAIGRDNEADARLFGLLDDGHAHVVAIALAVRHKRLDIGAHAAQKAGPERGRCDAVAVVVAM